MPSPHTDNRPPNPHDRLALISSPITITASPRPAGRLLAMLTLALVAGALGGCGSPGDPPPSAPATSQSAFSPTDSAWLELMIPMDEQFLRVLGLAATRSTDPAVRQLAAELTASHQAELKQLVAMRTRAGTPTTNPHHGHDMPGMMTENEITTLATLRGAAFEKILRAEIKDHLAQSALVTNSVTSAGHEQELKQLASKIKKTRAQQLTRLTTLD